MHGIKRVMVSVAALLVATTAFAALSKEEVKRLNESTTVLSEIRNASDNGIPESIWNKAECVVVIPGSRRPDSSSAASSDRG
jgi:lipid-binding SYLF domain-containing protein